MESNLERGILIRGGLLPRVIGAHITELRAAGILRPAVVSKHRCAG
jgi:hypothetical protein